MTLEKDVSRMYISRKEEGREMTNFEMSSKTTTVGLNKCLQSSVDRVLHVNLQHEKMKKLHAVVKEIRTKAAKEIKKKDKNARLEDLKKGWREKPLHGKHPSRTDNAEVDRATIHQWLRSASLKRKSEEFIQKAPDQSIPTRAYQSRILNYVLILAMHTE